ncbi:hypothetical protein H0H93_012467, partial [Arthromyces matolae]
THGRENPNLNVDERTISTNLNLHRAHLQQRVEFQKDMEPEPERESRPGTKYESNSGPSTTKRVRPCELSRPHMPTTFSTCTAPPSTSTLSLPSTLPPSSLPPS